MSNPEHTPNRIDLKSHQEEIRKQIEENTVVLYNLKDNNAFYAITPEEARFAIDAIKKRRENTHYCQIVSLKDQNWYKKQEEKETLKGIYMFTQTISNLQIGMKDYYAQVSVPRRGSIAHEDSNGEIFDIAVNPNRGHEKPFDHMKNGFLSMLIEKIRSDLDTYRCMLDRIFSDKKITEEDKNELGIENWEVAVKLLYGSRSIGHSVNDEWKLMSEEEKRSYFERMMKENEDEYKQVEKLVKELMQKITPSF